MDPTTSSDETASITEELTSEFHTVFQNKSLIKPETVVDEDRIVGRDEQLQQVINSLKPGLHGQVPEHLLLRGHSGTGKSLIATTVTSKLCGIGKEQGTRIEFAEANGKHADSEFKAISNIVSEFEVKLDEKTTPKSGVSTSFKYDRLYELVDENLDLGIIIFDELDLLRSKYRNDSEPPAFSDLLYKLCRAERIGNIDTPITVIVTTNSPTSLKNGLNSRTASTFNPTEVSFSDYDAGELRNILYHREDAFKEDALEEDVIPFSAARTADGEGDARYAIDLVREAGNIADSNDDKTVTEEHVKKAVDVVEENYVLKNLKNSSNGKRVVALSVAFTNIYGGDIFKTKSGLDANSAPSNIAYKIYDWICEKMDRNTRSRSTYMRRLRSLETSDTLQIRLSSHGRGNGTFSDIRFNHIEAKKVAREHEDWDRAEAVFDNTKIIKTIVKSNAKDIN
jgi:cell division control protein 6